MSDYFKKFAILQDLRYAVRVLRLNPGFTLVATLSLALGIGANTAVFSLIEQVILKPLPVQAPEKILLLDAPGPNPGTVHGAGSTSHILFSYPMYRDLRDKSTVFSGVLARSSFPASVADGRGTERVHGELVSGNYFQVLGVRTAIGNPFTSDADKTPGEPAVAVLSYGYWQRRFGGDTSILGREIKINDQPSTVIGVAAPGFFGMEVGNGSDIFVPMTMKAKMTPRWDGLEDRRDMWLNIFGRLKPSISPQQAEAEVNVLFRQILESEVQDNRIIDDAGFKKRFLSKHMFLKDGGCGVSSLRDHFSTPLILLMGFVVLVLLTACANLANLLMARGAARQKEIALRLALGAERIQVIRQLLVESVLLAFCGGAIGILLAMWLEGTLLRMVPADPNAMTLSVHPDVQMLLLTFVISLLTGVIFGLTPALQVTRPELAPTLKAEAKNVSGGAHHARFRKGLAVLQTSLSLVLVIGAGLFAHSLYNLKKLDPGFQLDHLLQFSVDPSLNGYNDQRAIAFFEQLQEKLQQIPGVKSVGAAEVGPLLSGRYAATQIKVQGYQERPDEDTVANLNYVSPGYFSHLAIPLLMGREFTPSDNAASLKVGLINQKTMQYWFHGRNPIGQQFNLLTDPKQNIEIVGVVRDSKYDVREDIPRSIYMPYKQDNQFRQMHYTVRTSQVPGAFVNQVNATIRQIDNSLPVFNIQTMDLRIDESLYVERMMAILSMFFAGLAALLAAIGLYGVMAYTVARRTGEIGIRVALGASRGNVLWLVMKEVIWMAAIGIGIAVPVAIALGHVVQFQLHGLQASDSLTLTVAVALLAIVALLSGFVPAFRASRISPTHALRYE
jgi:predicted permease